MTIVFKKTTGFTNIYASGPLIGTPVTTGGPDGAVQFNDGGIFGGVSTFSYDKNTETLLVSNISGSLTKLADGTSYLVAGTNISIASSSSGQVVISSTSSTDAVDDFFDSTAAGSVYTTGSFAFKGQESINSPGDKGTDVFFYVSGSTSADKALFGGDVVVSGSFLTEGNRLEVTGTIAATLGISGSLTKLSDGTSYLVAGSNVTILSSSNGSITISSLGGTPAGSDHNIQFNSAGNFGASSNLNFYSPSTLALTGTLEAKGDVLPNSDSTYNLGSADRRWANIYTGDLHLKNDRGDWTIVEEQDYLCVVNNITGKRYRMMLQPLDNY